jgi:hypothetical protein
MSHGIIYRIFNDKNNKSYIGKTKSKYGKSKHTFGTKGRLKRHFSNAMSKYAIEECPLLYNAIRKYGKESFKIETLVECNLEHVDDYEILMIKTYDSTNRNYGYNIALGGKGRTVVHVDNNVRNKISACNNEENFLLNIRPVNRNNVQVGYVVKRSENGIHYCKKFSSTKNSLEENLELAKKYLESIKSNNIQENFIINNKESKLPTNIFNKKKNGILIGYFVSMNINKKRYEKHFSHKKYTLEEKLELAIQHKKYLLNTYVITDETSLKKEQDNQQPSP